MFGGRNVRQQINTLTAFIDVGQVYGADDVKARFLRNLTSDKGLLKVNPEHTDNGRELLPFTNMDANVCATRRHIKNDSNAREVPCFLAGEWRCCTYRGNTHAARTGTEGEFVLLPCR